MEVYTPSNQASYRAVIQLGSGNIDRYVFQEGEGIASFFGNLFKSSVPIISRAIKGTARIVKPHLKRAVADVVTTGAKRILDKTSDKTHTHKNKRRRRSKL